jgi:hypothetical protein
MSQPTMLPLRSKLPVAARSTAALLLPIRSAEDVHQFGDLPTLIGFVAAVNRVFNAMSQVIPENFFLDATQRCPDRGDLGDDVDAVPILIDHFRKTAYLALDAVQPFLARNLDVASHAPYIPPEGIFCKRRSER